MATYKGMHLHEIGPYIGRMRSALARQLVEGYSRKGERVWDPFCGSGTVALECRLLSRDVVAADTNPYACILTRAKLHATTEKRALRRIAAVAEDLRAYEHFDYPEAPDWVKQFFDTRTLRETRILLNNLLKRRDYFVAGCLLGILHHQRPGFLSYPASHLIPYLRDRRYPRSLFPEAYCYRDPIPRLKAKVLRVLENAPDPRSNTFRVLQRSVLERYLPRGSVDAVITSPPYMSALDYGRDNRLRLWFLGTTDYKSLRSFELRKIAMFDSEMTMSMRRISDALRPGGFCVLVLGDFRRDNRRYDLGAKVADLVKVNIHGLSLVSNWQENLPDRRRSRRTGRATKEETVLVFRRVGLTNRR